MILMFRVEKMLEINIKETIFLKYNAYELIKKLNAGKAAIINSTFVIYKSAVFKVKIKKSKYIKMTSQPTYDHFHKFLTTII